MKINADFKSFASRRFDAARYIPSPAFGVDRFMLDRIGNERARATTIVRYDPNSKFPEHVHIGGEEFLVLEGTFRDQYGNFGAGTYVRNPIGSRHAPWVEDDGCTIMVKLLQMAEDESETAPLHVDLDDARTSGGVPTDYGTRAELYHNPATGERVQMCWMGAHASLPPDEDGTKGGEELFVIDGSLLFRGDDNQDDEVYGRWGWLRFPMGETDDKNDDEKKKKKRSTLKAGEKGAQVYRKTGHLTEKAMSMEKIQIQDE